MGMITAHSAGETKKIGRSFAKEIAGNLALGKQATVLALIGNLGAGKTTFVQGFAKGLGVKEKIQSPTFVLMKQYQLHKHKIKAARFKFFYHLDCYRLEKAKDALGLGLREILKNPENLVVIEWADKIKSILGTKKITLTFSSRDEKTRSIHFH